MRWIWTFFSVENSDQLSVKCVGGKILKIHFHSFRVPVQGQGVTWKRLVICRLNDAAAGPSALILNNHEAPFILFSLWLFLREPIIRCGTDLGPFGRWSHDNQWTWCFLQVSSSLRTDSGERERDKLIFTVGATFVFIKFINIRMIFTEPRTFDFFYSRRKLESWPDRFDMIIISRRNAFFALVRALHLNFHWFKVEFHYHFKSFNEFGTRCPKQFQLIHWHIVELTFHQKWIDSRLHSSANQRQIVRLQTLWRSEVAKPVIPAAIIGKLGPIERDGTAWNDSGESVSPFYLYRRAWTILLFLKRSDRQSRLPEWQSGAFLRDSIAGIKSVDGHDTSRDFAYS